jgi:hypothetical protein
MKKIFATLAVLSLIAGTVALAAPAANASSTWLFQGTPENQGSSS